MEKLLKQAEELAVERRPEACLGCGFEHSCSLHGCAVIKTLIEMARIEKDNAPLTLEELREMDGEPVWVEYLVWGFRPHWGIVRGEFIHDGRFINDKDKCIEGFAKNGGYGSSWIAYRCKPEGGAGC